MIFPLTVKVRRIIEKLIISPRYMEMPDFPCFRIDITACSKNLIQQFIEVRPDQNWLLMADEAAQSEHQLWTAWLLSKRAFDQNRALARSLDAEFLRYIAGTHHVSEAFRKVGITESHDLAWIVYLPDYQKKGGEINPIVNSNLLDETVDEISVKLKFTRIPGRPRLSIEGITKLGIEIEEIDENTEDSLIGLTISTDLNS